jgi:hypothetical protein
MIPDKPVFLKNRNLREFKAYQNRTPSKEEIEYSQKAEKYFESNQPED